MSINKAIHKLVRTDFTDETRWKCERCSYLRVMPRDIDGRLLIWQGETVDLGDEHCGLAPATA